jgi:hypothetical protein
VVKLNVGFSGEGNAILPTDTFDKENLVDSILYGFEHHMKFETTEINWVTFSEQLRFHGALAEEWVENVESSPSA